MHKLLKLLRLLATPAYRRALSKGAAAAIEHERLLKALTCSFVVDVGANKGQFALVAHTCHKETTIISFEPLAGPANIFENVFKDDTRVRLERIAIGKTDQAALIHISEREDSSSLLPIAAAQISHFPGTAEKGTELVQVRTLPQVLNPEDFSHPALLKIDVQGFELSVLEGSEDLLKLFDFVYVECSFVELYTGQALAPEIISWLQARSFSISGVYNVHFDRTGIAFQADFLFNRSSTEQNTHL